MSPAEPISPRIRQLISLVRERLAASSVGTRLARGTFWLLSGTVASRSLALITSVVMARMLGRAGFGELGMIQSTIGMFQTFAGFELGVTATKYVAEFKLRDPERAGRIVGLSTMVAWSTGAVVALAMLALAPVLSTRTLSAPQLTGVLRISSLALLLGAVSGAQAGALYGFEAFRRVAWVNFLTAVTSLPLMTVGALFFGLTGAAWALVLTSATNVVLGNIAVRAERRLNRVPVRYRQSRTEWPVLFRFSLPALLTGVLISPIGWICQAIVINQPGGFDQMGWFTAANQWQMALLFLPSVLGGVVGPVFADLAGPEDQHRYWKLLCYNAAFNVAITAAIAVPVCLVSPYIMSGYGSSFTAGYPVLLVLCCATVVYSVVSVSSAALVGRGLMWWGAGQQMIWATVMVAATFQLRGFGALGLAFATLLAYLAQLLSSGFLLRKIRQPLVVNSSPALAQFHDAIGMRPADAGGGEHER